MKSYKELIVYQKGYSLSLLIYQITAKFPEDEKWGMVSQMRRSAVSIPCNIAEGYKRKGKKEYIQFLHVALGSCGELETLLSLSKDLNFVEYVKFEEAYLLQEEISKMLTRLIASLSKLEGKGAGGRVEVK